VRLIMRRSTLICAIVLDAALLPRLSAFLDREITFDILHNLKLAAEIIGVVFVIGLLSGAYPASSFPRSSRRPP